MKKTILLLFIIPLTASSLSAQRYEKHVIHFDFDQYKLLPASTATLDSIYTQLSTATNDTLYLIGHTDSVGNPDYNVTLSENRVNAAREYLLAKGIQPERLEIKYYGETRPIADNKSDDGRQKNRRVDLFIKKDCGCKKKKSS